MDKREEVLDHCTPQKDVLVDPSTKLIIAEDQLSKSPVSAISSVKSLNEGLEEDLNKAQGRDYDTDSVHDDDVQSLKAVSDGVQELDNDIKVELDYDVLLNKADK